jgi:hypothetical protein
MPEVEGDQLRQAVESQHGGKATLMLKVPVKETFGGVTAWEGAVHIFALTDHPTATRAFAWSSPIEGSTERRFFVVLQIPPVTSPTLAVRAAIMAERRSGGSHEPKRDKPRNGE